MNIVHFWYTKGPRSKLKNVVLYLAFLVFIITKYPYKQNLLKSCKNTGDDI